LTSPQTSIIYYRFKTVCAPELCDYAHV